VVPWVVSRARAYQGFEVELADLRDWPLPIFAEHPGTIGDINDPTYSEPIVQAWNKKVKQADAFIVITPEYSHSIPGGLKNAVDSAEPGVVLQHRRPSRPGPDRGRRPEGGGGCRPAPRGGARGSLAADHRRRARFAQYQHETGRELPVIRLVPRHGPEEPGEPQPV
jgi:hypothetical protein